MQQYSPAERRIHEGADVVTGGGGHFIQQEAEVLSGRVGLEHGRVEFLQRLVAQLPVVRVRLRVFIRRLR